MIKQAAKTETLQKVRETYVLKPGLQYVVPADLITPINLKHANYIRQSPEGSVCRAVILQGSLLPGAFVTYEELLPNATTGNSTCRRRTRSNIQKQSAKINLQQVQCEHGCPLRRYIKIDVM